MSNPRLSTIDAELDNLTEGMDALQVKAIDETSSGTKKTKLSARDLLATLSQRRIFLTEIEFIGKGSQDGGAYGDVVVATFVRSGSTREEGRRVAVKKLRFVLNDDMTEEKFLRIFVNELRVLDKLSHPNIVEIIGFVEDVENRIAWLVFPWEDNGNLREFLRSGQWEIPERVSLILDVALGLEYLHTSQPPICHGDLKSLNILVNSSNRAIITDFGSARVIRQTQEVSNSPATRVAASTSNKVPESSDLPELTITTSDTTLTLTGPAFSLRWSPPEVLNGESLDLTTDIWALGWVAWEAITDCYPFDEAKGELGITMKIIEGRLPLIRDHMQLSQIYPLCNMMQKCWKPEPKERPSITRCRQALSLMPCSIPVVKNGDETNIRSAVLLLQVGYMHSLRGRSEEASKAYNQGLTMARLTGDRATEASIIVHRAENDRLRSKYVEAEAAYIEALAICESIGFDWCRANGLFGLGEVQLARSKYVEAEASYTQALAVYESIGGDLGVANALLGLGRVQFVRSKYVEAEASCTQTLAICETIESDSQRAIALRGLGNVQQARSKYVEAEASYTQALAISESIGDDLGQAEALQGLGGVQLARSQYVEAEASHSQALSIYESIGNTLGQARAFVDLGHVQGARSMYVEAEASYAQGLAISENIGDDLAQAEALRGLGGVQLARFKYVEAEASYTQALAINESIGHTLARAKVFGGLGNVQRARSKYVEAEASYAGALAIYESIGDDPGRANALGALGHVQVARSKFVEAEASYAQALVIQESIGNGPGRANALHALGRVQVAQSKFVEAEASFTQMLAICESIGNDAGRVISWLQLGQIRLSQARYAEAKTLINDASIISEQIGYDLGKTSSKKLLEDVLEKEKSSSELQFKP